MSHLMSRYEDRLREREIPADSESALVREIIPNNVKFTPSGEIKPYYGLTCITWIDPKTHLYQNLCEVQKSIKDDFELVGVGHVFSFLEPSSFHMTICDISSSSSPCTEQEAKIINTQIRGVFSQGRKTKTNTALVRGIGLISTLTALVRFTKESELKKALDLECKIKQATKVDVRKFTGHISLAYCVTPPGAQEKFIWEILHHYHDLDFGELIISKFDLTCFTDMNTFVPMATVNIDTGHLEEHTNLTECQFC